MSIVHEWADFRRLSTSSATTGISLAATGLAVWIGLSVWAGTSGDDGFRLREAWDSEAYFVLGVPLMALAVAFAAYAAPERIWRWPLWLVGGHQIGVLLVGLGMQSGLSLVLLTLILAVLLTTAFAVPAFIGGLVARRMTERAG